MEGAINIMDAYRKCSPDSLVVYPTSWLKYLDDPGMTADQMIKASRDDISEFMTVREKYLLYK